MPKFSREDVGAIKRRLVEHLGPDRNSPGAKIYKSQTWVEIHLGEWKIGSRSMGRGFTVICPRTGFIHSSVPNPNTYTGRGWHSEMVRDIRNAVDRIE